MRRQAPTRELSESEFQSLLFSRSTAHPGIAVILGWRLNYHTFRSVKSPTGFPDWVIARERIIFAELKTQAGKVTAEQQRWIDGLRHAGGEAYVWRHDDLDDIAAILRHRGRPPAPCEWCGRALVHHTTCGPRIAAA